MEKDRYNIVLATPFEDFEADKSRYPLYEEIARMLENDGLKTFVPHRDIKDDRGICDKVNGE